MTANLHRGMGDYSCLLTRVFRYRTRPLADPKIHLHLVYKYGMVSILDPQCLQNLENSSTTPLQVGHL